MGQLLCLLYERYWFLVAPIVRRTRRIPWEMNRSHPHQAAWQTENAMFHTEWEKCALQIYFLGERVGRAGHIV